VGVNGGREWWRPENIAGSGTLCWMRGEFEAARSQLEEAAALLAARPERDVEAEWFMPFDPIVLDLTSLAQARWVLGDLAGADAAVAGGKRYSDELGFPQGPFSLCYAHFIEIWICLEAGRFQRAAKLAADMVERGEHHGFDQWIALGAVMQKAAAVPLDAENVDADSVSETIAQLTGWVEVCRFLDTKFGLPSFDGRIAQLLIASGRLTEARDRVDAGLQLAEETGMHYYDAELLRLRAKTHNDADACCADLNAAMELSRRQGATIFVLRAALDDFERRGEPARQSVIEAVDRIPADSTWPELARARALLG
jgi:hypothetical protein